MINNINLNIDDKINNKCNEIEINDKCIDNFNINDEEIYNNTNI
jgi:hypothetical protein